MSSLPVEVRGKRIAKEHLVGELPLREPLRAVLDDAGFGQRGARGGDDEGDGPLVPLRMRLGDDCRLCRTLEPDDVVLEIDGRDPFPPGLHEVLGAVRDDEVLLGVDGGDVPGHQPPVPELVRLRIAVVLRADPRSPHQQLAERHPVVGYGPEVLVDDLHLEPGAEETRLGDVREPCVIVESKVGALRDPPRHRPEGVVSVMPQAWIISTRCTSQYQRMRERGGAEPPHTSRSRAERSWRSGSASRSARTPCQMVGTPAEIVTPSDAMRPSSGAGAVNR